LITYFGSDLIKEIFSFIYPSLFPLSTGCLLASDHSTSVDQAARKAEQDEYFVRFYYPSWLNKFSVLKKKRQDQINEYLFL
jgi:hypothetical protein